MRYLTRAVMTVLVCSMTAYFVAGCGAGDPVEEENRAPGKPHSPGPADGAILVSRILTLSWKCSDPDNDPLTFKVMLYKGPDMVAYGSGLTNEYWEIPDTLDAGVEYGWQVTATEQTSVRKQSIGGYWTFTTGSVINSPPGVPSNPVPSHGAADQLVDVDLSWTCTDSDPGDTLAYDVHFGTSSPPTRVSIAQEETTYDPGTLNYNKTYYWQVVATDELGYSTAGPEWSFTTEALPGGEGVFTILTMCRSLTWFDPILFRVDGLSARFDSAYAPCDTIKPLRAAGVSCSQWDLSWLSAPKTFVYTQDPPNQEFLTLNGEYVFNVTPGGGVPALSEIIVMPSCEPYITSPCAYCEVPVTGFTLTWDGFSCGGEVRIIILKDGADSTGVDILTTNDGSRNITQAELDSITDLTAEYAIILIHQNMHNINAAGYDPRSWIWARTMSTTIVSFTNP